MIKLRDRAATVKLFDRATTVQLRDAAPLVRTKYAGEDYDFELRDNAGNYLLDNNDVILTDNR